MKESLSFSYSTLAQASMDGVGRARCAGTWASKWGDVEAGILRKLRLHLARDRR